MSKNGGGNGGNGNSKGGPSVMLTTEEHNRRRRQAKDRRSHDRKSGRFNNGGYSDGLRQDRKDRRLQALLHSACSDAATRLHRYGERQEWDEATMKAALKLLRLYFFDNGEFIPDVEEEEVQAYVLTVVRRQVAETILYREVQGAAAQELEWFKAEMAEAIERRDQREQRKAEAPQRALQAARDHLGSYGTRRVPTDKGGKMRQRWSQDILDKALKLVTVYFTAATPEEVTLAEANSGLSENVLQTVRWRFAASCLVHRVHGMPGQSMPWYAERADSAGKVVVHRGMPRQRSAAASETTQPTEEQPQLTTASA